MSAIIRVVAERWTGAIRIDSFVRAYFREAFHIPMLLIGPEQVEQIARGAELAVFNERVAARVTAAQPEWDKPAATETLQQARAG